MSKTLVLRPRGERQDGNRPTWHDTFILATAIDSIVEHKSFSMAAMWMNIAAKIELAREEIDDFTKELPPFEIDLRNVEARKLWDELRKLKPVDFGRNQKGEKSSPPAGLLYLMMTDIAEQLGEKLEKDEDDDGDGE